MDLRKIIHELEIEKQRLDEAILALERLSTGTQTRKITTHNSVEIARELSVREAHSEPPFSTIAGHSLQK